MAMGPEHERITGGGGHLGGSPGGDADFPTSGTVIRVDFGEVEAAHKQMVEAKERFDRALRHAEDMARVLPPGRERPSHNVTSDARQSATDEVAEIRNMRDAAAAIAKDLKAQLDSQREVEETNASGLNGIGG
jgi:ABC-type enterochelin transport system substrate-binding protein